MCDLVILNNYRTNHFTDVSGCEGDKNEPFERDLFSRFI